MTRAIRDGEEGASARAAKRRRRLERVGDVVLWTLFLGGIGLPVLFVIRPQLFFGLLLVLFYLAMLPGALIADLIGH